MKNLILVVVCLVAVANCLPEPPVSQGWMQQQTQQPQVQGWAQPETQGQSWGQQPEPPVSQGWGQQQTQPQVQGWAQPETQGQSWGQPVPQPQAQGWTSQQGYQGEKGQGHGGKGQKGGGGGGWSSEPETNIKKPSIREIFNAIISFPREIKRICKESGLWILFLPLLILIPLWLLAFSAGKYYGGKDDGWGWDKRSHGGKTWLEGEWDNLKGFIKDPKVQRAAKGFMDEFVASRIVDSVFPEAADSKKLNKKATKAKEEKKSERR